MKKYAEYVNIRGCVLANQFQYSKVICNVIKEMLLIDNNPVIVLLSWTLM